MEDWYIDLSKPEDQGSFGHDCIDKLKEPGFYKLPFKFWEKDGNVTHRNIVVRVAAIFGGFRGPGQCIVVENDLMYVFYYNGNEKCFKPNFENESLEDIYNMIDADKDEEDFGPHSR